MRLLLVLSAALIVGSAQHTHGLRSLRALAYPKCTAAQTTTFIDNLSTASDGCTNSSTYDWGGDSDPLDDEREALCKCTVSSFAVPKCYWIKDVYGVNTTEHFAYVYNCSSVSGKATPRVTEVDAASYTPTPTTVTPTPTTPTPKTATPTPTTTPTSTAAASSCSKDQLSTFNSSLFTASSGCMGGSASSYNWGGTANPKEQLPAICKCTASAFDIPQCTVVKEGYELTLSVHYDWVMNNQCSGLKSSSSSNVALIVGIAGGVVASALVIAIFVWKRRRNKAKKELHQSQAGTEVTRSPVGYNVIDPHTSRTNTCSRPTSPHKGSSAMQTNDNDRHIAKSRSHQAETAAWDDPVIKAVRIPLDSIFFGALISSGGFGEVYRGMYRGESVAIKQLLPARRKDLEQIASFLGEVKLMSSLEHERIVKFIGVAWNSLSDACMVVEFMENGDLRSVLSRWDSGPARRVNGFDADKVKIALHIAHALVYLHSLQPVVVHRDFKSKNILLDANMDAKLTDFGISRERADSTMTAGVGSSLWMAPEVMMGNRYDEKADIFAFGVVLSELDTHQLPYSHAKVSELGQKIPETAILQLVMLGRVSVGFTDHAEPALVQLGRECVSLDPKARPTTAMVLHRVHQVMQGWHRGMVF